MLFSLDAIFHRLGVKLLLVLSFALVGCSGPKSDDSDSTSEQSSRRGSVRNYDSISELDLAQFVAVADQPVLVEIGVDFSCVRCEQMTPLVNGLQEQFAGRVTVVRTPFNPSSATQSRFGLNMCPTYLFYCDGKLVDRCDGPTMLPTLSSKLSKLVAGNVSPTAPKMSRREVLQ